MLTFILEISISLFKGFHVKIEEEDGVGYTGELTFVDNDITI